MPLNESSQVGQKEPDLSPRAEEIKQAVREFNGAPTGQAPKTPALMALAEKVSSYWWVELVVGILWTVIAVVVLKFNHASVTTVGILTGIMFLAFAAEDFLLAYFDRKAGWLWAIFGVLLTAGGIVALVNPVATFVGFADILGFVFLVVGVRWMVQAFAERIINSLWWITLTSGILMTVLAFWVSDRLFVERAYTLLIFAGVWAMTNGVIAIIRALQLRELGQGLRRPLGR